MEIPLKWLVVLLILAIFPAAQSFERLEWPSQTLLEVGHFSTPHARADAVYLHGLGDRFQNHLKLFSALNRSHINVVAINLPSHGKSTGNLNNWSADNIARELLKIINAIRSERPQYLIGYSLGGLLAIRITQMTSDPLAGLILINPATHIPLFLGESGYVTNRTLTHDRALYNRDQKPNSQWSILKFGWSVRKSQQRARQLKVPRSLPTLLLLSDPREDYYIQTVNVEAWAKYQPNIEIQKFHGARHELDNELAAYGADLAIEKTVGFVTRFYK